MGKSWNVADPLSASDLNLTGHDLVAVEAGENLTAGQVVYVPLLNLQILDADADSYVAQSTPTTNYGTNTSVVTGGAGTNYEGYISFDFSNAPSSSEALAAYLMLAWNRNSDSGSGTLRRLTSSWNEGGVTWNTKPTNTSTNEVTLSGAGSSRVGHRTHECLTLYGDIQDNTNNGFYLTTSGATGTHNFDSRDHGTAYLHPRFIVWGTHADAGKAYVIDDLSDPTQRLGYMGVVVNTVTSGNTAYIMRSGKVVGLSGLTAGQRYFSTAAGALSTTESSLPVGFAFSATELWVIPPKMLPIATINLGATGATSRTSNVQMPMIPGCDWVFIQNNMEFDGNESPEYWETWLDRDDQTDATRRSDMATLSSGIISVEDWDADEPDMEVLLTLFRCY